MPTSHVSRRWQQQEQRRAPDSGVQSLGAATRVEFPARETPRSLRALCVVAKTLRKKSAQRSARGV